MKHVPCTTRFIIAVCIASSVCSADETRPDDVPTDAVAFSWNTASNDAFKDSAAWSRGDELFVTVSQTGGRDVRIPRLANVVLTVSEPAQADRKWAVHPEPDFWILKPSAAEGTAPSLLQLKLDAPVALFDPQFIAHADEHNAILLSAKLAVTHGELLRFEPQSHKNTVGYWANEKDTVEWFYRLDQPGSYDIDILQGCGKGHGGSRVALKSDGGEITFDVTATGHFQNFIWRTLGTVTLPSSDRATISLKPLHKAAGAVMDVRAIRIVPHGTARSFEPELADAASLPPELLSVEQK